MPSKRRESAAAAPQAVSHFETPVKRFQSRDAPPPPPAISLATGEALQMSRAEREQWCSEEGGQSAARRGPESDQLRLLGTTVLNLSIPNDGPSNTEKLLGLRLKPTRPRAAEVKWGWRKNASTLPPVEHWEKQSGEVLGQGFASASAVFEALYEGKLLIDEPHAPDLLHAISTLSIPDPTLWASPLIRCLVVPPAKLTPKSPAASSDTPARPARPVADLAPTLSLEDGTLRVRLVLHVYFSRLLLYMIAHPSIRVLMTHLRAPVEPTPVAALPRYSPTFRSTGGEAAPFSLEGVLKSVEHAGYRAHRQPAGLALTLKPYQQQALAWMVDMEALPGGINSLFWEVRPFADGGDPFHYSPQLGEMRLSAPPLMHGGVLAEEMGLGKTLEVVGLVLSTLNLPLETPPSSAFLPSRSTLVVVPPALVSQWLAEIQKSIGGASTLSVAKYTTADLIKRDAAGRWRRAAAALASHDLVIATYGALDRCTTALGGIAWRRVVLDEMQEVRSSTTELARKCERLSSPRRWMVSGTPLYDKISDLQGELYFLRVSPFGAGYEDGFWRHVIEAPWEERSESALDGLQLLLRGVMMRHSKTQTTLSGAPILALPPKTLTYQPVPLLGSERTAYALLEHLVVSELRRAGGVSREGDSGALASIGLRLLREGAVAMHLLGGGAACPDQLRHLEELSRARLRAAIAAQGGAAGQYAGGGDAIQLRRMTPSAAIVHLGSSDRLHTDRQTSDRFHNASHNADMVRHAHSTQRVHDRSRSYAVDKLQTKLDQAKNKEHELKAEVKERSWEAASARWRWALERVTTGGALCRARLRDPREDPPLGGTRERDTGGEVRAGGGFRWLWLCRGVWGVQLQQAVGEAEAALAAAEGALRRPPLVPAREAGMLVFEPATRPEAEAGLAVLHRPLKLRSDVRTEDDASFNRALLAGRLRPGQLVEPRTEIPSGEDDGAVFVRIAATATTPAGFILNRPRVVPALLAKASKQLDADTRAALPKEATSLPDLGEKPPLRAAVFKACVQRERAARDDARAKAAGQGPARALAPAGLRATAELRASVRTAHPAWLWLRSSVVVFRRLPDGVTANDLMTSTARFRAGEAGLDEEVGGEEEPEGVAAKAGEEAGTGASAVRLGPDWYVDLGSESCARSLVKEAGGAGVPLELAAESHVWAGRLEAAEAELAGVAPEYEEKKAAAAAATAAVDAKAAELGVKKFAAFVKTMAGRALRAERAEATTALQDAGDGDGSLTRRYNDARRRVEAAAAGRRAFAGAAAERKASDGPVVCVELCRLGEETSRRRMAADVTAELAAAATDAWALRAAAAARLAELRPYVEKLLTAQARGLDAEFVEQAGFQELFLLERGEPSSSVCPICYEGVGANGPAVTTPCAHLFCRACMLSWVAAQSVMVSDAQRQGASAAAPKPCPCCRHPFTIDSLIELTPEEMILAPADAAAPLAVGTRVRAQYKASTSGGSGALFLPGRVTAVHSNGLISVAFEDGSVDEDVRQDNVRPEQGGTNAGAESSSGAGSSAEGSSGAGSSGASSSDAARSHPDYTRAYTRLEIDEMEMPAGFRPVRVGRCPSVSAALLGHMQLATGLVPGSRPTAGGAADAPPPDTAHGDDDLLAAVARGSVGGGVALSSRVSRLLSDLSALGTGPDGLPRKAVVFSQHRAAIRHLDFVLSHVGVPHITITKGDAQAAQESAVAAWTSRPACRVFLLHAGAAAAGLTLVAASHIFLMEPFDKQGQELQALNRCHRIGQEHAVSCTVYYAPRSAEERLLAYRELERGGRRQEGEEEAVSTLAEGGAMPSAQKLRFLFGMLRRKGEEAEGEEGEGEDGEVEVEEGEGEGEDDEDWDGEGEEDEGEDGSDDENSDGGEEEDDEMEVASEEQGGRADTGRRVRARHG